MAKIIGIAAMGLHREIGENGQLPWHNNPAKYRDDMLNFKHTTLGRIIENGGKILQPHPCIVGSSTWNSIPSQYRPFDKRPTIVVTSQGPSTLPLTGAIRASSIEMAIHIADQLENRGEIYICGGASMYHWALDHADELLLTEIPESFPNADTFFPEFKQKGWIEFERKISKNQQCEIVRYKK